MESLFMLSASFTFNWALAFLLSPQQSKCLYSSFDVCPCFHIACYKQNYTGERCVQKYESSTI